MIARHPAALAGLYEEDEVAWLDAMAGLIEAGARDDLDFANLHEYLAAMARSERREVKSRLAVLIAHVLKWTYQPDERSRSWHGTILHQREELKDRATGVLLVHAEEVLPDAYRRAVKQAAAETGIAPSGFPAECPHTLAELLAFDPAAEAE